MVGKSAHQIWADCLAALDTALRGLERRVAPVADRRIPRVSVRPRPGEIAAVDDEIATGDEGGSV
jgi:hypothetical protein